MSDWPVAAAQSSNPSGSSVPFSFRGRVVWITGAAGGLGRALCARFLSEGAIVAASDLDPKGLAELGRSLGRNSDAGRTSIGGSARRAAQQKSPQITKGQKTAGDMGTDSAADRRVDFAVFPCDVTSPASVLKAAHRIRMTLGPIHCLVVNAGITHRSAFADTDPDVIRRVVDVNLMGAVYTTKAALSDLTAQNGRIIVMSSMAGVAPLVARTGYAASKHALHGFFNSLYTELGRSVHVQIVCPMFIRTPLEKSALGPDGKPLNQPRSIIGSYLSAEEAADRIVRRARTKQRLVFLTFFAWFSYTLYKFLPALYERLMTRKLRAELANR